jgi:REP element-mobilizing transposase RayT
MNHGIRDHPIFRVDADRELFLRCLREAASDVKIDVVAFCLMGNHFHLVLHCVEGGLSELMHRLTGRYARQFNRRHGFEGSLFRSRFTSVAVTTDEQLLAVTRYVHRNPLELGQRIDNHPWSSYSTYLGSSCRPWIDDARVIELASGRSGYRSMVEARWPTDRFAISDGVRSIAPAAREETNISALHSAVETWSPSSMGPKDRRSALVLVAMENGGLTAASIASSVGLFSASAVRGVAARSRVRLAKDPEFADLVRNVLAEVEGRRAA